QNQTVPRGSNAIFAVAASGSMPLSYQWEFNNAPISGATQSSYTLFGVQTSDAGQYSVVVTNIAGSITSSNALLTVPSLALKFEVISLLPAQQIKLVLTGPPGTYSVEYASNLASWVAWT